ncbi:hypothetical protein H0H81_003503 [Sphagnurus paluster]|uniref:Uncharacterized protein n=1 Tax=Sphagnurus paluster TaxID=117069 RepID=A0A9P7K7P6_9AGAR|nr:hypothetical protein H0H81_003503 [Sphagnurus paluster]
MPAQLSQTTLIIVVVGASLAATIILVLLVRLFRASTRTPAAPLPPVQPLAHRRLTKPDSYYDSPTPSTLPPSYTPSDTHTARVSPASSDSLTHSERPPRPLSSASISSLNPALSRRASRNTIRGAPHAPHSHVQIILPAPLAPAVINRPNSRQSLRRDTDSDRLSLVDKWISLPRDDDHPPSAPVTPVRPRRPVSGSISTSPSSFSYFIPHSPPPPVPHLPLPVTAST